MNRVDVKDVETMVDLIAVCNGVDLLVLYLRFSGYRESEIASLMNTSRQAVFDRLKHIQARYHAGQSPRTSGRPRKPR